MLIQAVGHAIFYFRLAAIIVLKPVIQLLLVLRTKTMVIKCSAAGGHCIKTDDLVVIIVRKGPGVCIIGRLIDGGVECLRNLGAILCRNR